MKTKTLAIFLTIGFLFISHYKANPQVTSSYKSISVSKIKNRVSKLNKIVDLTQDEIKILLAQDSIEARLGYPFRFGKKLNVDIDLINESTSVQRGDTTYFTYEIKSPSAYSINLIFDQFELNDNSALYIYNNEGNFIYGPVTSKNNPPNGIFWTDLIEGDHIILELIELNNNSNKKNQLHISKVVHGYKRIFPTPDDFGDSWPYPCNIDIACPEGDNWRVEGNAVAMLLVDEDRFCSGSLINNTAYDFKGYLLTAFHCLDWPYINCSLSLDEKNAANNWLFRLQYESPSCNGIEGTEYITMNGANFRAAYQPTDFALLELYTTPTLATYAGWQRTTYSPNIGVGIHHPEGDVKKISLDLDLVTSYGSQIEWPPAYCISPPNTHWRVDFDQGTTQGGSSGSPLFNENYRIVGQLHGGETGCAPITKYYGRFNISWTGEGTNDTRLSNWLDPINSGVLYLDTKYSTSATLSGPTLVCSGGAAYTVSNVPPNCTLFWENGPNLTRISAQGSNPCTFSSTDNGPSWIRVKIKTNSNNGYVTLPQHNVWSGVPILNVSGPEFGYTYNTYTFYANPGAYSNPTSYTWILNPLLGNNVYNYGSYADIAFYDPWEGYQVISRAQNTCGLGDYSVWNISIYDGGEEYSLFPNPASEVLTVTVKRFTSTANGFIDKLVDNEINIIYTIRIFDFYGNLQLSTTRSGSSFTLPISNLKDGNYIVQIANGKKSSNLQLVIKHQ